MAHWRNTFKNPRFFMFDARVSIALIVFLLHIRLWTFLLVLAVFIGFYWMERYGYDVPSALRAIRTYISGNVRPTSSADRQQHPVDFDRRPLF